jgi:hypothetical protein
VPYRIGKVKSEDPSSRENMYSHLKNMGAAGFAILSPQDEISTLDNNSSANNPDVFKELINLVNSEMSKLVLGASGITDGLQSGTQTQSNVHQLQLDVITKSDVQNFEYFINELLIPKLNSLGLNFNDYYFEFKSPERMSNRFIQAELDKEIMALAQSNVFDIEYLKETYGFVPNKDLLKNKEEIKE